jgi:ABC-2 type transport system permease protein
VSGPVGRAIVEMMRIRTLIRKEFLDLARNRAALVPVVLVTAMSLVLPFGIAILIPVLTGRGLGDDADLVKVSATGGIQAGLSNDARVQLFLFQQFLMLFLLTPITGAMALAAHAIVGEKQARTLEPLLATPITTFELLAAKVFGALIPTLAISLVGLALYFAGIVAFGAPGVASAMASARTLVLIVLVAPAAALVSLQSAILISSRVNDARTAQQFGVLIIIPLTAILVAQFTGSIWLTAATLAMVGAGLLVFWLLLTLLSVVVFDREAILTRWR